MTLCKPRPRNILSNEAKKSHLEVVARVTLRLLSKSDERLSQRERPISLALVREELRMLDRLIMLNKAEFQANDVYRKSRWTEIDRAAFDIARDTGELYSKVLEMLGHQMRDFL
jgi:hypothetical protein